MRPKRTLSLLPGEILLHIISFLEPPDITRLQQVSRKFFGLGRDDGIWRAKCWDQSAFLEALERRQKFRERALHGGHHHHGHGALEAGGASQPEAEQRSPGWFRSREKARVMANWDPSYPSEKVSWYDEYIQRHGPVVVNWFQQPRGQNGSIFDLLDVRGVSLYRPDNPSEDPRRLETLFAVSPLDDGSVCLWDVGGSKTKRGAVHARSSPGILFIDGPGADNGRRSKRVDSGVTECVSVDSHRNKAFVAVQSHLIEVDLETLSVIGLQLFPWSITTLSTACPNLPLTVGTTLGIHLYDYRARTPALHATDGAGDGIDSFDRLGGATKFYERSLKALLNDEPLPPYASLAQPGPLSVLHLQKPGDAVGDMSDDIYVAGRFSNILHYDRRKFPSIKGSIHSGARLCSLTSLPFGFSALDSDLRRKGLLSFDQLERSKATEAGRTIVACGEYNTKGSLELYGLSPPGRASPEVPGGLQTSTLKNRQTSSQSKLLSVVNHGTRLALSDGSGLLKWFERDGFTEVRRVRIGHSESKQVSGEVPSLFGSMVGPDDMARKLLPTRPRSDSSGAAGINENDLLFWTGDKLGLASFSARPGFGADDFEDQARSAHELELEKAEREYGDRMRRALQNQAQDARFVQGLGLGIGRGPR